MAAETARGKMLSAPFSNADPAALGLLVEEGVDVAPVVVVRVAVVVAVVVNKEVALLVGAKVVVGTGVGSEMVNVSCLLFLISNTCEYEAAPIRTVYHPEVQSLFTDTLADPGPAGKVPNL